MYENNNMVLNRTARNKDFHTSKSYFSLGRGPARQNAGIVFIEAEVIVAVAVVRAKEIETEIQNALVHRPFDGFLSRSGRHSK